MVWPKAFYAEAFLTTVGAGRTIGTHKATSKLGLVEDNVELKVHSSLLCNHPRVSRPLRRSGPQRARLRTSPGKQTKCTRVCNSEQHPP